MSVTICCDYCGRPLNTNDGRAAIERSTLSFHTDGRLVRFDWKRQLCAGASDDTDSCLLKVMRIVDEALSVHRTDLGLEWQLVPTNGTTTTPAADAVPPLIRERRDTFHDPERDAARKLWEDIPAERRAALVLEIVGDGAVTIREIREHLDARLRTDECGAALLVSEQSVRSLVSRLFNGHQLDRAPETFRKTRTRYRYSRRPALDGPIADLDRAFNDDGAAS